MALSPLQPCLPNTLSKGALRGSAALTQCGPEAPCGAVWWLQPLGHSQGSPSSCLSSWLPVQEEGSVLESS